MQVANNLEDLEQENERFKNEVDILTEKQQELENIIVGMEQIYDLPDFALREPLEIPNAGMATMSDYQRQKM